MIERRFGNVSLFANVENLLNVRLMKYEPLLRPQRARDGPLDRRRLGPTEGRGANAGIRVRFGGE